MKFYIHKLGCPKNDVDADYIIARLQSEGHNYLPISEEAEVIIINTCGFILPAKEESIDAILQFAQLKTEGIVQKLFVTGCLSQRYGEKLLADIPELDGAFGLGELDSLAKSMSESVSNRSFIYVDPHKMRYLDWKQRFISDDYPYAYLKIADGCNRRCTFCAIPSIRGRYRSRTMDSIFKEARFLVENGKRELILVSQEATSWGNDLDGKTKLTNLLRKLNNLEGLEWIRIMYLHPSGMNQELFDYMANDNKTLAYFDLPLQHICPDILKNMGRPSNRSSIEDLIKKIHDSEADTALRTTFIVGFPGETNKHFEELCQFVKDVEFDRMGAFVFSPEEGTPAANLPNQVPDDIKAERLDRLMMLQQEIAFARNNSLIGKQQEVIIDTVHNDGTATGRTRWDCPEIDQEVVVNGSGLKNGLVCQMQVVGTEGYDLRGLKCED